MSAFRLAAPLFIFRGAGFFALAVALICGAYLIASWGMWNTDPQENLRKPAILFFSNPLHTLHLSSQELNVLLRSSQMGLL
ncbi:hypothetical protein QQF64_024736 [Cirrhinus molitorella]|uniref:Uncharacterized protein n=1 Tax=Cirrhinus molitorella TaxID=172907 RepID=A0ABR3NN10_9TELE